MTKKTEDMNRIMGYINAYGFEKTFKFEDYEEIDNVTFHKLHKAYLRSRQRLVNYVISHSDIGMEDKEF